MTTKQLQERGAEIGPKTELIVIGNQMWKKGPDGLWYRLDEGGPDGPEES